MATKLEQLSAGMPIANQRLLQQQKATQAMQLQQAAQARPATAAIAPAAQAVGAQVAQNVGQQMVEAAKQTTQQAGQLGAQANQQQEQQVAGQVAALKQGVEKERLSNVQRLAALSEQAKQEVFDSRMRFDRDEMGRTHLNERQLADYLRLNAGSEEKLRDYQQKSELMHSRKMEMLAAVNRKLEQQMQFEAAKSEQARDQQLEKQLVEQKRAIERKMQREQAVAANNAAMWQTGGTVIGAVAGAPLGPAGVVAGAAIGGAVGSIIGSQQ